MTPLYKYATAVPRDITFKRLWLSLKGKSIKKNIQRQDIKTILNSVNMELSELQDVVLWSLFFSSAHHISPV
jgi:hypothetical protein